MKIAVVYNRESKKVINLFGMPNREKYGLKAVKRITDSLKKGKHQVRAFEGDKDIIDKLEEFMPQVLKGERPGMVFNISYGVQGQARYTHIPSILEMVGIPYVGSGPLAHSLSLDKVVAKMMFKQEGLLTPDFFVLDTPEFVERPDLNYPMIVKPKNEAVSLGLKVVYNDMQLREAVSRIIERYKQSALIEQYIDGQEINVGLLGNDPPEAFTPAELIFPEGPHIYSHKDKTHTSGREVGVKCPADLSRELSAKAQELALLAFKALGCYDCARVDMRLDKNNNFYILEVNSLPSLGEHGSYVAAAEHMGLDFPALINRLVDVASARYFGMPSPPQLEMKKKDPSTIAFNYISSHRDRIERRIQEWTALSSRTGDPIGLKLAHEKLDNIMAEIGMKQARSYYGDHHVLAWETAKGLSEGTLLIGHLDVPRQPYRTTIPFSKDPEWLYGEGVGSSRAPLVMTEYVLKALKAARKLNKLPIGILYYTDLGYDCRYSTETIRRAIEEAGQVMVLWPGNPHNHIITQRRGQRKYLLTVAGKSIRLGQTGKGPSIAAWVIERLNKITGLSSKKERLAISFTDIRTEAAPMLLPHKISIDLLASYLDPKIADRAEEDMNEIIKGGGGVTSTVSLVSDRPPMKERRANNRIIKTLKETASDWDILLEAESSLWPTVAGLVPPSKAVICGIGPVARDLYTFKESVRRVSIIERTLLLAEFLLKSG
jgi:D-alanine-D-alanine ligase